MAVLAKEDFLSRINERIGEDNSDEAIEFMEDMTDTYNDMESALMVAMVFGVTSPKINIRKVRIPVAIPAPALPKKWIASDVETEEADRFTMLLPIKMAESILPGSSVMRSTRAARLFPDSARVRIRILLTVVSAVSAEEKNAERNNKIIIAISCPISPGPNKLHLIIIYLTKYNYLLSSVL